MAKGCLITFEGIDGCGKSTQATLLFNKLCEIGIKCIATKEPGSDLLEANSIIRDLIFGEEYDLCDRSKLFLFLADRANHYEKLIRPALEDGFIVISDRSGDSTRVYQREILEVLYRTFDPKLKDINEYHKFIKKISDFAAFGISPDVTILIDINPEIAVKRIKNRQNLNVFDKKEVNFYEELRKRYLDLADYNPNRIKTVNGDDIEIGVAENVWNFVKYSIDEALKLQEAM